MALACEPRLLIADEPTTALDVTIQKQILELLDDLKARLGMAMILITHDLGVIAGRADKVVVMYAGKIVEQAETLDLFQGTRHPYTEALLESIPQVGQATDKPLYAIPGLPPDLSDPPKGCRFAPRCSYTTVRCNDEEPMLVGDRPDHPFACFYPVGAEATLVAGPISGTGQLRSGASVGATPVSLRSGPSDNGEPPVPLLVLDHVAKEFPVTSGAVVPAQGRDHKGRERRLVLDHRGRDFRTRRGVGLRQDDPRTHDHRPRTPERRPDPVLR